MRFTLLASLLFVLSCSASTIKNVSKSDFVFKHKIGSTICTATNTIQERWNKPAVRYFEHQEYRLIFQLDDWNPNQTLAEYNDGYKFARYKPAIADFTLYPKGTKLQIKEVYFYKVASGGAGHMVMATVNGSSPNGKLVNIAKFFRGNRLDENYAAYCESN